MPVTVKMRKGIDDNTITYLAAAHSAEDAGACVPDLMRPGSPREGGPAYYRFVQNEA